MPKIAEWGRIRIYMYYPPKEHPPCHIHIKGIGCEVSVDFLGNILKGISICFSTSEWKNVMNWINNHQKELQENCTRAQNHRNLNSIPYP
ncbi:protein of unknown function [Sulfobacillus thermosulfidooxidans DSM 9293]|uniref:DUF4160 domain-containing protein n=2 Tax=Sulfobacillus thermosulfidooxidans TaxID=28034 RepID=A0A1W1WBP3_SULTA|nr:protein of unknown function [Sulfobacillus thermosulfidooxidans DSM 9293]